MTIIKTEDLPERMKERHSIAHSIAEQAAAQIWQAACYSCQKIEEQATGNDALSFFGTILIGFAGRWIIMMDKIAKLDDAGIETEELVKTTINGILDVINCKAEYEDQKEELPDGIKRIKLNEC